MARYTGPRKRVVRRLGTPLEGLTQKSAESRPYPPGQHGQARARRWRRASAYSTRLAEKQKIRFHYGVTERQLRRYFTRAARMQGRTGENLLSLLEQRLDNVVFRLGLAPTIPAARQLIVHRHVTLNDRRVSIPSIQVEPGDQIGIIERARTHQQVAAGREYGPVLAPPSYLQRAPDGTGRCIGRPVRRDTPLDVRESLVVEFYAR